jgi:hypothetical protein
MTMPWSGFVIGLTSLSKVPLRLAIFCGLVLFGVWSLA